MTANEAISSWEKIQQGVKEAETLMGKREYNLSMVKARQTLEFMVHCLCDQAGIMEPDLSRSIDALYNERVITKTTCEHYHKIRMLGNSAVHENNTSAYDANQAYQFLSQEVTPSPMTTVQANAARQPHPRAVPLRPNAAPLTAPEVQVAPEAARKAPTAVSLPLI